MPLSKPRSQLRQPLTPIQTASISRPSLQSIPMRVLCTGTIRQAFRLSPLRENLPLSMLDSFTNSQVAPTAFSSTHKMPPFNQLLHPLTGALTLPTPAVLPATRPRSERVAVSSFLGVGASVARGKASSVFRNTDPTLPTGPR